MKILFKTFLLLFAVTLFSSCGDLIDIEQPGRLTPDATFENVSDLNSGLLGAYAELDYTPEIQFSAVFTDEISIGFDNGGQGLGDEYNFILNPSTTGPSTIWTNYYDAVNAATRIIEAADLVTPEEGEQEQYNSVIGQAHAIRAFSHFMLLTYFSADLTDDSSLGVISITEIPEPEEEFPRNTTGEVFSTIESDLNQASNLIPSSLSDVTLFTQDAITALRARIATYRQDYSTAEQLSQQLLDDFNLATQSEYLDMFRLDTDDEVIFKLERTVGDPFDGQGSTGSPAAGGWVGANFAFTGPDIDGSPYFEMSRSLYNELDPADVRYEVNVSATSEFASDYPNSDPTTFEENDIIPVDKYRGSVPGEGVPLMNDLKVFRVAEILLINAEAEAALGNLGEAALLIKELRDARFGSPQPLPTYANAEEAFGDILDERRVELAFEGHRYIDLGRLGARANREIDRDPLDCNRYNACNGPVPGDDHRYRFPIPLVEIDGNNAIADQQNEGY